jgi:1,4-dihydroxy-2-naphthoyl-CoA hydrolase
MNSTPDRMAPAELVDSMPFASVLGITVDDAGSEEVRGHLDWTESRCTINGILHGGALMTFADSVGAICAFLNLPSGAGTTTIQSATNFFRAVRSGTVLAISRPLHVGRSTIVVQTELYDDQNRLVGQVTQTQSVIPAAAP